MRSEQLLPRELDAHVSNGTFRLAFVGMSNAGKSYRSRVLQNELDFFWYEVDAHIQETLGIEDMGGVSEWLGYPTSKTYKGREQQYLDAEEKCTHLHSLETGGKNLVFDTTGSVIYLSEQTRSWLTSECLVVNIDVGEDAIVKMTEKYFAEPKPVIWGDYFSKQDNENDEEALRRCYPEMLRARLLMYGEMAHLSIPFSELHDKSGEETLTVIKEYL